MPAKPIQGETKTYTSYIKSTTDGAVVFFPVIVPLPIAEPIPPIPPEEKPPLGDAPEEPATTEKPQSSAPPDEPIHSCTKPTPEPQKPAVTPVTTGGLPDNPFAVVMPGAPPVPDCNPSGSATKSFNPESLLRLADKFCKDGMGSVKTTLDLKDVEPENDPEGMSVEFEYLEHRGNCPTSCKDVYKDMVHSSERSCPRVQTATLIHTVHRPVQ